MNRDIIVTFGRKSAVTATLYGEMVHWQTLQFADLAYQLSNADRIFGYRIEYHLAALAEYGFNAARRQADIFDYYAATHKPLAELLYANNVAAIRLTTPEEYAAAVAALTRAVITNGVLFLTPEEYITYPSRIALCLA